MSVGNWIEPGNASAVRQTLLARLAEAFDDSPRSTADKLDQFPKFAPVMAMGRFLARYEMFKLVENVPGAIVEAGVLAGSGLFSFVQCSFLLEPHNTYRKLIGFDTFAGFPSLSDTDTVGTSAHMRVGGYTDDSLAELTALAAIHEDARLLRQRPQIELVKGDMVASVPKYVADHPELVVALLYLDADLYEPTAVCLQHLFPRMPKGAVIVFDELGLSEYPGETDALAKLRGIDSLPLRKLSFSKASYAIL